MCALRITGSQCLQLAMLKQSQQSITYDKKTKTKKKFGWLCHAHTDWHMRMPCDKFLHWCDFVPPAMMPLPYCLQFGHYFWPSVVGIVPGLIIYVWLGSLAADVTEAVAGGGMSTPPAGEDRWLRVLAG